MAVKPKAKKKPARKASSKPRNLTAKQQLFCRYFTQNRALFGNATHSYAEAYGYKLDELSREDAVYAPVVMKDGVETGGELITPSSYDRAISVCSTEGARLLRNPRIQELNIKLLNELLEDTVVDSELARLIVQDRDPAQKLGAIREYNALRNRVKREMEVKHTLLV